MEKRILKLTPGYFVLWLVLMLVTSSKIFLLRGLTPDNIIEAGLFGLAMVAISYLGAWAIWAVSGKEQRTGDLAYLAIITVIFLTRTVLLYSEGFAAL